MTTSSIMTLPLFIVLFLLVVSDASIASGRHSQAMRYKVTFKAGELKLIGTVTVRTSTFETGKVLKSKDAKIIRETRNIKYKVGKAFGVSMFNIRNKTKVKFRWYYPTILDREHRSRVSVYSSPEYWVNRKHHIYWSMENGEKLGKYRLDIYFNGRLAKRTTFNIRR